MKLEFLPIRVEKSKNNLFDTIQEFCVMSSFNEIIADNLGSAEAEIIVDATNKYYNNQLIELKNIDISTVSKEGQLKKIFEEFSEVFNAIENESDEEVAAETLDLIQALLGYVHKTRGVSANYIMEQYPKHLEKIKNRPRDK